MGVVEVTFQDKLCSKAASNNFSSASLLGVYSNTKMSLNVDVLFQSVMLAGQLNAWLKLTENLKSSTGVVVISTGKHTAF